MPLQCGTWWKRFGASTGPMRTGSNKTSYVDRESLRVFLRNRAIVRSLMLANAIGLGLGRVGNINLASGVC